jgi:hypothetical protein
MAAEFVEVFHRATKRITTPVIVIALFYVAAAVAVAIAGCVSAWKF